MCIINVRIWDYCNHMRQTSSEACFYVLSRLGMTTEECPHPQHNLIEQQPDWPCPICTMQTNHLFFGTEAGNPSTSKDPSLVAATENLDITNDDYFDMQHASTATTNQITLSFGRIPPTPVDRLGAQTPDCPHGPWYCSICHPDEASDGFARSTAIVNTSTSLEDIRGTQPMSPPEIMQNAQ